MFCSSVYNSGLGSGCECNILPFTRRGSSNFRTRGIKYLRRASLIRAEMFTQGINTLHRNATFCTGKKNELSKKNQDLFMRASKPVIHDDCIEGSGQRLTLLWSHSNTRSLISSKAWAWIGWSQQHPPPPTMRREVIHVILWKVSSQVVGVFGSRRGENYIVVQREIKYCSPTHWAYAQGSKTLCKVKLTLSSSEVLEKMYCASLRITYQIIFT